MYENNNYPFSNYHCFALTVDYINRFIDVKDDTEYSCILTLH